MAIAPSAELLQLQKVIAGRYWLERELGRGGMGIVFLARDIALDRPVALKLLPSVLAIQPELRERFLREARTAAKLSHPNIVPIHLVEQHGDVVFFVMTFVDGETLGQRVRRAGPLSASQATRVVQEVAWALAYAHGRGVVHRDVKPDNILLDKDTGRAMVTDFGIARVAETATMSRAGEIVGTMQYMSPEQASGEAVDGRSDLFSLGVTAFYALTGKLPFDGPNLPAIILRIVSAEVPRLATLRPDIPLSLAESVDRCLAKQPDARFASGEELADKVGATPSVSDAAPEIRYFLKFARDLEPASGMLVLGGIMLPSIWALWSSDWWTVMTFILMLGSFIALPILNMFFTARRAIKAGLGPADVRRAFERALRTDREDFSAVWADPSSEADRATRTAGRRRKWMWLGHAGLIGVFIVTGIATQLGPLEKQSALPGIAALTLVLALFGYAAAIVLSFRPKAVWSAERTQTLGLGERLMGTRFVDWLFRAARVGLDVQTQNEPPASERTEVLIGVAAGELFDRLPPRLRAQFAAVPIIVRKLQNDANLLRQRDMDLGRTPAGAAIAEVEAARAMARERLASAVAALENIRVDLLRVEAGLAPPDDLTADLEKARAIGAAVDAELKPRSD